MAGVRPTGVRWSWVAVVVLLTACTTDDQSQAEPPQPVPSHAAALAVPPDGMRWQGFRGQVFAVPESWATSTDPCAPPQVDTVRLLSAARLAMRCPFIGPRNVHASVLTIAAWNGHLQISCMGPRRPGLLAAVRASVTDLPDGWVVVPRFDSDISDDDAVARLARAGLHATAPDVDWPHYVTGTDPVAGTPVPPGTDVDLEIGDG